MASHLFDLDARPVGWTPKETTPVCSPAGPPGPIGTPIKRIRGQRDIEIFKASPSYKNLRRFMSEFASSIVGVPRSRAPPIETLSPALSLIMKLFETFELWIAEIPLEDLKSTRFGNKAARLWHERLRTEGPSLVEPIVACCKFPAVETEEAKDQQTRELNAELCGYLFDSFGNPTRLDYGSGHELHFFLLIYVLAEAGAFHLPSPNRPLELPAMSPTTTPVTGMRQSTTLAAVQPPVVQQDDDPDQPKAECQNQESEATQKVAELSLNFPGSAALADADRQGLLLHVFWRYIDFMRKMQSHYRLEPAGSHGVWGLDDYHHLPFLFGAAQLSADPPEELAKPEIITNTIVIERFEKESLYCAMINWIFQNKKGPFHEHSSMLYNISGVHEWAKIVMGMAKMYDGEVLHKINITQHLLFGARFPWPEVSSPQA